MRLDFFLRKKLFYANFAYTGISALPFTWNLLRFIAWKISTLSAIINLLAFGAFLVHAVINLAVMILVSAAQTTKFRKEFQHRISINYFLVSGVSSPRNPVMP